MSDPAHNEPATPSPEAQPPVGEDLYCLGCGYNLRGLAGDPRRCPECGEANRLGEVRVPAPAIRLAERRLETCPTRCVACAMIIALTGVGVMVAPEAVAIWGTIAAGFALAWLHQFVSFAKASGHRDGWRTIVWDFHIAMLLMVGALIGPPVVIGDRAFLISSGEKAVVWTLAALAFFPLGVIVYRRARRRLRVMNRLVALDIAEKTLRRKLDRRDWLLSSLSGRARR